MPVKFCLYCGFHFDSDVPHPCASKTKMFTGHPKDCRACGQQTFKEVTSPVYEKLTKAVKKAFETWSNLSESDEKKNGLEAYVVECVLTEINQLRGIERLYTLGQINDAAQILKQVVDDVTEFDKTNEQEKFNERMLANKEDAELFIKRYAGEDDEMADRMSGESLHDSHNTER